MAETTEGSPPKRRLASAGWPVALALLVTALHARSVGFGFVVFDDYSKIVDNRLVTAPSTAIDQLLTPSQGYIIPITVAYWAAAHRLGGGQPWPFHLGNLLLHATVVLLLFWLARRLCRDTHLAGLAALLLAAHPITVEPVAWATGAKDLLAAVFALAATALFSARVAIDPPAATAEPQPWRRWAGPAAAAIALLAMLSKPTTTLLGGAWLALLVARHLAHRPTPRRAWVIASGTLAVGLALGALGRHAHDLLLVADREPLVFGDLRVPLALGHQLHHLLWPASLHPMYLVDKAAGLADWHTTLGLIAIAALAALGWYARRAPTATLGLALAAATYLPVSNLLPFPRIVADSYLYLPLGGLLLAAAAGARRLVGSPRRRILVTAGTLALATPLSLLSWWQVDRWRGGDRLWAPLIADSPGWDRPHGALATSLLRAGRPHEAARRFRQAFARGYRPEWLGDFGVALASSGRLDAAECVMLDAIHHGPSARASLANYALLLGRQPRRPPRYPAQAAALLPLAAAEIAAGRIRAGPRLRRGLARQRARVGSPPALAPSWPRRHCAELRR